MVRALSWPATSHASRVTGCHHVCPCVKLWEEGVHSQWIHWEEWLSASEKCLKWVTAVHWESETASAQCTLGLHISHCPAQLNCSLNMFERVSEQKFWTIPVLSFYTCYAADVWMGLCQIITREHFKKMRLYSDNTRTRGGRCRNSLETKLSFNRKFKAHSSYPVNQISTVCERLLTSSHPLYHSHSYSNINYFKLNSPENSSWQITSFYPYHILYDYIGKHLVTSCYFKLILI